MARVGRCSLLRVALATCLLTVADVQGQAPGSAEGEPSGPAGLKDLGPEKMRMDRGTIATRRILVGDQIREYVELDMEFPFPVYASVCERHDAVYVSAVKACIVCEEGCTHSSALSRLPPAPGLPSNEGFGECLCGISFEEMVLRAKGRPGDIGLEDVERRYPRVYPAPSKKPPLKLEAYATALWQYDTLLANVECPGGEEDEEKWPLVSKLGLNGLPLSESLWWLRRFDTAFGIEDIDVLLANASASYNDRQVVLLIPVSTMRHGRKRIVGPSLEELRSCSISFPLLMGPQGEPLAEIDRVGSAFVPALRPCRAAALQQMRTQIQAVVNLMEESSQQREWCYEDWRSSYAPGDPLRKDVKKDSMPENMAEPKLRSSLFDRNIRVGSLVWRSDFVAIPSNVSHGSRPCSHLRWRLRLRAYNLMERAAMYTATDAINGCWDLLERVGIFGSKTVTAPVRKCMYDPDEDEYWKSPCCNLRLLRTQCCPTMNMSINVSVVKAVNTTLLAQQCRPDHSGGGLHVRSAVASAAAWQRSLTDDGATQSCFRSLAAAEQGHSAAWRTIVRCHRDIMGYYDRELQMYVGLPCVVDEDCFTECAKPGLDSMKTFVSITGAKDKREVLGRCRVPTQMRHQYLVRCLLLRSGKEILGLMGLKLGTFPWRDDTEGQVVAMLAADKNRRFWDCVGPLVPRGEPHRSNETCLARKACNWNFEIPTRDECTTLARGDNNFCGCMEGHCPQLHEGGGCVTGTIANEDCHQARAMLRPREMQCRAKAATVTMMQQCAADVELHNGMFRSCIKKRCVPDTDFQFIDQNCVDRYKQRLSMCYDECTVPTGPNPQRKRDVCYMEMNMDESAADCYKVPGDTEVHYDTIEGVSPLRQPEEAKPRYCSVRIWKELQTIEPYRYRRQELARLDDVSVSTAAAKKDAAQRIEGVLREKEVEASKLPLRPPGCDIGLQPLEITSQEQCLLQTRDGYNCCLSPINVSHGLCRDCKEANVTVCPLKIPVLARWPPNRRLRTATLEEDLGKGNALVSWIDNSEFYRTVPWAHIFDNRPDYNTTACIPVEEGCSSHHHCDPTEYCYSCAGCAAAFGGNPAQSLCAPCLTKRGGACGTLDTCAPRQDAIDGVCPVIEASEDCPCKKEWHVYGEYEGAPLENSINECFFEKKTGNRWCEIDPPKDETQKVKCGAKMITGVTRFIWWRDCDPPSCDFCQCDCREGSCQAYNVVPFAGRLPFAIPDAAKEANLNYLNLTVFLSPDELSSAGVVAPNCSELGAQRIKQVCPYCVSCCADYCHGYATDMLGKNITGSQHRRRASVPGRFDCTSSNITGCSDLPRGWVDNAARSCADYETQFLCTPLGGPGAMWLYDPPRGFEDFALYGRSATQSCCACGGGVPCADDPSDWADIHGNGCGAYRANGWCNRTGYGPAWDTSWGAFPLGTSGVDARTACCFCGGGEAQEILEITTHVVDEMTTCMDAFPGGRAKYEHPPWIESSADMCPLLNGICQHKLNAMAYYASAGKRKPDDPRIISICEQKSYEIMEGKDLLLEDGQGTMKPPEDPNEVPRRLKIMDVTTTGEITQLQRDLQYDGSVVTVHFNSNRGKGICYYKLPDPLGFWGGPRTPDLDPPWLLNRSGVFAPPGLYVLGWPWDFRGAMPQTPGKPTKEVSSTLRALLATNGVELAGSTSMTEKFEAWQEQQDAVSCSPPFAPPGYFKKYRQDVVWRNPYLADGKTCMSERCNVDPMIMDEDTCKLKRGCLRNCAYCSSKQDEARDQGMCYTKRPEDVKRCDELGGVRIDGPILDEISGVPRPGTVCALPHRPLISCNQPMEYVKRCAHFGEDYCETDRMAKLMGCALRVRPCQTEKECQLQGRCSDVDLGLSWATLGTCVITPVDDGLLERVCDERGLCFFAIDPAFGMEVRRKHWLLDLLGPEALPKGPLPAPEPSAQDAGVERLRSAGRLNKTECAQVDPGPGRKAIWMERQRTMRGCERWKGCCLQPSGGGRCELFTGQVVDVIADPAEATRRHEECELCGGEWMSIFRWETDGGWVVGSLRKNQREWKLRAWESANEWTEMVSAEDIRRLFENVLEERVGGHRRNCVHCTVEPLLGALMSLATACGETDTTARVLADAAQKEVEKMKELDALAVTTAEKKRSTAALWTARAGVVLAEPPPAPLQAGIGSALAAGNIPGQATFGGQAELSWHPHSAKPNRPEDGWRADKPVNSGGIIYTLSLESEEAFYAMAAPQLALAGRLADVQDRLIRFVLAPDESAGALTSPPPLVQSNQVGKQDGYPSWAINEMINMDRDPSIAAALEAEKVAILVANAEASKLRREAYERAQWAAADAASGLPLPSQRLLLDPRWPREDGGKDLGDAAMAEGIRAATELGGQGDLDQGFTPLGDFNSSCRNVVANSVGDVNGMLLGDCVRVDSTGTIVNSVELCLKLSRGPEALNDTSLGQYAGVVLDFARRDTVPGNYSVDEAAGKPDIDLAGNLAAVAWDFRTGPEYGRLKPGWSKFTALGVPTSLRRGGSMLCARVFEEGVSYCPIARIDARLYFPLPRFEKKEVTAAEADALAAEDAAAEKKEKEDEELGKELKPLSSECPQLDAVLGMSHAGMVNMSKTGTFYQPLAMQATQPEVVEEQLRREEAAEKELAQTVLQRRKTANQEKLPDAVCAPGSCVALAGRGLRVAKAGSPECVVAC